MERNRHKSYLGYIIITFTAIYLVLNLASAKNYAFPTTNSNDLVEDGYIDGPIIAIFIATAIAFLIWLHRCIKEIETRKGPQAITSAGAVYWWFVPIAFFWKPYQAVKIVIDDVDSEGWMKSDLPLWWASWIVANVGSFLIPDMAQMVLGSGSGNLALAAMYGLEGLNAWFFLKVVDTMMGGTMLFHGWGHGKAEITRDKTAMEDFPPAP